MLRKYGVFGFVAFAAILGGLLIWNGERASTESRVELTSADSKQRDIKSVGITSNEASLMLHAISTNDQRAVMSSGDGKMIVVDPTSLVTLNDDGFGVVQFSADKLVLKSKSNGDLYLFHKAVDGVSFLQRVSSTPPVNAYNKIIPVKSETLAN